MGTLIVVAVTLCGAGIYYNFQIMTRMFLRPAITCCDFTNTVTVECVYVISALGDG